MNLKVLFYLMASGFIFLYGCSSSKEYEEESEERTSEEIIITAGYQILKTAKEEQQNKMYSQTTDSTYLYWLNNQLIILNNSSKCNVYALNVLFNAGFKCPHENVLTFDLMDTSRFNDIFPVIKIDSHNDILRGDLIIWSGHVIIFESLTKINNLLYAKAWWAGTNQENNGENIINNVVYGNYPLQGDYIVRRPMKKI